MIYFYKNEYRIFKGYIVKEYKVVTYKEGIIKAILFGEARIRPKKLTKFLNVFAQDGWESITMDKATQRVFFLFARETYTIVFHKNKPVGQKIQKIEIPPKQPNFNEINIPPKD